MRPPRGGKDKTKTQGYAILSPTSKPGLRSFRRGTGIDGYLDGLDVGVAVEPGNVDEIGRALVRLVDDNADFRRNIRAAASTLFARFDPDINMACYRADIEIATGRNDRDAA